MFFKFAATSAACVFCLYIIGGLNTQRFDVFVPSIGECGGKWYIQHVEASVLQEFPRKRIFLKKFSCAECSAELSPSVGYYERILFLF